jgi:hypothetical protein
MSVLTKIRKSGQKISSENSTRIRRSLREMTRRHLHETKFHFVIEVVLFAIIAATAIWPIMSALGALNHFLEHAGS